LCITLAERVRRGIKTRMISCLSTPRVQRMWVFPTPIQCTTTSELGQWGWRIQKHASGFPGRIVGMPQTEANALIMQSFSCVLPTSDSTSASSVSAVHHLLPESSSNANKGSRSIAPNASSCVSATILLAEGALGNGGGGGCILQHGGVFLIFFSGAAPILGRECGKNKEESKIVNVP
jgi:hypothetical protein